MVLKKSPSSVLKENCFPLTDNELKKKCISADPVSLLLSGPTNSIQCLNCLQLIASVVRQRNWKTFYCVLEPRTATHSLVCLSSVPAQLNRVGRELMDPPHRLHRRCILGPASHALIVYSALPPPHPPFFLSVAFSSVSCNQTLLISEPVFIELGYLPNPGYWTSQLNFLLTSPLKGPRGIRDIASQLLLRIINSRDFQCPILLLLLPHFCCLGCVCVFPPKINIC